MIELRLLGAPELRKGGSLVPSFLRGAKRTALLAYLALERRGAFHRRDRLLPLFWPERDERRARSALRNMLFQIRRALGEQVVVNRGPAEIGVPDGALWCDVAAFREAATEGRLEEAAALYRADLLDGFHLPGASVAFEHWLDGERARLKHRQLRLLERLGSEAERRDEPEEAARWWRQLCACDPYLVEPTLRLVDALVAAGRRREAAEVARRYARRMEEELGVPPDPEVARRLDRLRSPSAAEPPDGGPAADRSAALPEQPSIAVLPFDNLGPEGDDYFGDGLAEELIGRLAGTSRLRVAARTSSFSFKGRSADVVEIGRKLRVDHVLEGSVRRSGGRLRIAAQLIETAGGYHLWARSYERRLEDVFAIQEELSRAIAAALQVELTQDRALAGASGSTAPADPGAYDLYLRGRHCLARRTPASLEEAVDHFERALATNPEFAPARAGLAEAYLVLCSYSHEVMPHRDALPRAERNARAALEADPGLSEAHVSLGMVRLYQLDWEGARQALRRAVELDPGLAAARHRYGWFLALSGDLEAGRVELRRAEELDPLSLPIKVALGRVHQFMGDPAGAIEHFRDALEIDPQFADVHVAFALTFLEQGRFEAAMASLERARAVAGDTVVVTSIRGVAFAAAGRVDEARAILEELYRRARQRYISAGQLAPIHGLLGELDEAFRLYERALEERSVNLVYLRVTGKLWEPIRSDPRFRELLRRIGP